MKFHCNRITHTILVEKHEKYKTMAVQNNISIFLVEDDITYSSAMIQHLKDFSKNKVSIETFPDGDSFLKRIEHDPNMSADVVILDYFLNTKSPYAMNGIEVLKKIKEIDPKITVIMLSGQDKLEIAADSIKCGAYEYIVKSESAFIRIQNILKNLIEIKIVEKTSKTYEKWNIIMAIIIFILLIIDIVMYYNLF